MAACRKAPRRPLKQVLIRADAGSAGPFPQLGYLALETSFDAVIARARSEVDVIAED